MRPDLVGGDETCEVFGLGKEMPASGRSVAEKVVKEQRCTKPHLMTFTLDFELLGRLHEERESAIAEQSVH